MCCGTSLADIADVIKSIHYWPSFIGKHPTPSKHSNQYKWKENFIDVQYPTVCPRLYRTGVIFKTSYRDVSDLTIWSRRDRKRMHKTWRSKYLCSYFVFHKKKYFFVFRLGLAKVCGYTEITSWRDEGLGRPKLHMLVQSRALRRRSPY